MNTSASFYALISDVCMNVQACRCDHSVRITDTPCTSNSSTTRRLCFLCNYTCLQLI